MNDVTMYGGGIVLILMGGMIAWSAMRSRDARIRAQARAEGRAQVLRDVVVDSRGNDTAILAEHERETKAAQTAAQAHAAERKRLDPAAWLNDKGRPGK